MNSWHRCALALFSEVFLLFNHFCSGLSRAKVLWIKEATQWLCLDGMWVIDLPSDLMVDKRWIVSTDACALDLYGPLFGLWQWTVDYDRNPVQGHRTWILGWVQPRRLARKSMGHSDCKMPTVIIIIYNIHTYFILLCIILYIYILCVCVCVSKCCAITIFTSHSIYICTRCSGWTPSFAHNLRPSEV
jgi:hypothetical protein